MQVLTYLKPRGRTIPAMMADALSLLRDHWTLYAGLACGDVFLYYVNEVLAGPTAGLSMILTGVLRFYLVVLGICLTLRFASGQPAQISDCLQLARERYLQTLLAVFTAAVLVFLGLTFFILPGLYLAARLLWAPLFCIDRNLDGKDALRASFYGTQGYFWILAFLVIVRYIAAGTPPSLASLSSSAGQAPNSQLVLGSMFNLVIYVTLNAFTLVMATLLYLEAITFGRERLWPWAPPRQGDTVL